MGTDIWPQAEVKRNGCWERANIEIPSKRNYWTFAILAGVRNGQGFAGCDLGDSVQPIAEPRGIPRDTSLAKDDLGYHSFSWVTLGELLALDLDALITERGMVSARAAEKFRKDGIRPDSWSGWTSEEGAERIQWQRPIREAAWLLVKIIEALKPLGEPENVRLVFGFDS